MPDQAAGASPSLPPYFYRLSARAQNCYLKSDSIERYDFVPAPGASAIAGRLASALEADNRVAVEIAARELAAELCRSARVRAIRIDVMSVRPHNTRGELHGIFDVTPPQRIVLWMRTAMRHDVVKPRTFIRTLAHEMGHYFDYSLLRLPESFHTQGFFKRESSLMRLLIPRPL